MVLIQFMWYPDQAAIQYRRPAIITIRRNPNWRNSLGFHHIDNERHDTTTLVSCAVSIEVRYFITEMGRVIMQTDNKFVIFQIRHTTKNRFKSMKYHIKSYQNVFSLLCGKIETIYLIFTPSQRETTETVLT